VSQPMYTNPDLYTDHHVNWTADGGAFAKGRRVWRRIQLMPFAQREVLRKIYEPRQYFPEELVMPTEAEIREAHAAYRGAA
jgi:hypothetical protein